MRTRSWTIIALIVPVAIALYSFAGYVLAPYFIEKWIESRLARDTGYRPTIGLTTVNPFTFQVTITDTNLIGTENPPLVSIPRVEASIEPKSLLVWPVTVASLRLDGPELFLERIDMPDRWAGVVPDIPDIAVRIERLQVVDGRIQISDSLATPPVRVVLEAVNGAIKWNGASGPAVGLAFQALAQPDGGVRLSWMPKAPERLGGDKLIFSTRDFPLPTVSGYFHELTGHRVMDGRLGLALTYRQAGDLANLESRLQVDQLKLARGNLHSEVSGWPVAMAAALVEDESGRIDVSLPARQGSRVAGAGPVKLFIDSLRAFVQETAASPFQVLADVAGRPDLSLGGIPFQAGSAEINIAAAEPVAALAGALAARPKIALRVSPAYDPVADRRALAAAQISLHVALATGAGPPGGAPPPPDVDDPKVRTVLDEFAATRLAAQAQAELVRRFPGQGRAYYEAVMRTLAANQPVATQALERLARYRARAVIGALSELGVAQARLNLADEISLGDSGKDRVMLPLDAGVFQALDIGW